MEQDLRDRYRVPPNSHNAGRPVAQPQPQPEILAAPQPVQPQPAPTDLRPPVSFNRPVPQPVPAPVQETLPEPVVQTAAPKRKAGRKMLIFTLFLMLAIVGAAGLLFYRQHHHKSVKSVVQTIPLPSGISAQVNFPIYYPSPTPGGYTYSQNSAVVQGGLVFFKMFNGSKSVFFTEQAAPKNPVDFSSLPSFQRFNVPAGQAALGTNLGKPSGLVVNGSTLINVSSTGGATAAELKSMFQAFIPLSK